MKIGKSKMIEIGMEAELKKIIKTGRLRNKNIYVMGSLNNIHRVGLILREQGLKVTGVLDNNQEKHGKQIIDGIEYMISAPDILLDKQPHSFCIIIFSIRFWGEMRDQLLSMSMKMDRDFYILEAPLARQKIKYILKGYKLYKQLLNEFGKNTFIFLFWGPLGDNYLFGLFYQKYCEKNNITDYVWVGNGVTAKIAKIYGVRNFVKFDREEIVAMEFLYSFLGDGILNMKILQIWEFQFHFNRCRIRFAERFDFIDTYRHYVFNLPKNTATNVPGFQCNEAVMWKKFSDRELKPGQTVILSPYAYSIAQQPSKEFWINLSEKLQQLNYSVCVNINPEIEENYIPNTTILEFDLCECGKYLEYAGYFIGMRSGFCDVISSVDCRKIVLYPKRYDKNIDYDRHRYDMDFGGLKNMGLSNDAIEIEFPHDNDRDDLDWHKFSDIVANLL